MIKQNNNNIAIQYYIQKTFIFNFDDYDVRDSSVTRTPPFF